MLNMGLAVSFEQLVIDCEFADMIQFGLAGIPVNDETLSVDLIKELGSGKDYLSHKNTFQNRKKQSQPKLMDRRMKGPWERDGSTDMVQKAKIRAKEILATYKPVPIPQEILLKVQAIINEAEDEFGLPHTKISTFYFGD